ncbi:hypothetical protein ACFYY2_09380 [Streptomyces sp. NPDC001822]|uniref:hypothetical protein n=1 Tax=Streptomyces sp. NPDC001822 TaxID=3364614 RepID=UPI003687A0B1
MRSVRFQLVRACVAVTAMAAIGVSAPAATAAEAAPTVSAEAGAPARAFAAANEASVLASATVCGDGYEFVDAKALPNADKRYGTLFFYMKGNSACAILDNNTPGGANFMDLRMYPGDTPSAGGHDSGNFSSYAGPVRSSTQAAGGRCVTITALMKNEAGTSNLINWKGGYVFAVDTPSSPCA